MVGGNIMCMNMEYVRFVLDIEMLPGMESFDCCLLSSTSAIAQDLVLKQWIGLGVPLLSLVSCFLVQTREESHYRFDFIGGGN